MPSSYGHPGGYQLHRLSSRQAQRQRDYPGITDLQHRREGYKSRDPDIAFLTHWECFHPYYFIATFQAGKPGPSVGLTFPRPAAPQVPLQLGKYPVTLSRDKLNSQVRDVVCLIRGGAWLVVRLYQCCSLFLLVLLPFGWDLFKSVF